MEALTEIQKAGANARAMGRTEFDNPYLQESELPRATGEPVEKWLAKWEAWQLGWKLEGAVSGQPV